MTSSLTSGCLIFLHVPKAAGTTLNQILEREYPAELVYKLQATASDPGFQNFIGLPEEKRARLRVLIGHMAFGLHTHLPEPSAYVTVLRRPSERIVSHYYYVLRQPQHYLYKTVVSQKMTLEDYAAGGLTVELDNGQTRLIAGDWGNVPIGQCGQEMLERAKSNLTSFFAITGLMERFDETLLIMKRKLGWNRQPYYTRRNVNESRPSVTSLSPEFIKKVEQTNPLDCALYDWVAQNFERELREQGDWMPLALKKFKLENNLRQRLVSLKHRMNSSGSKAKTRSE